MSLKSSIDKLTESIKKLISSHEDLKNDAHDLENGNTSSAYKIIDLEEKLCLLQQDFSFLYKQTREKM